MSKAQALAKIDELHEFIASIDSVEEEAHELIFEALKTGSVIESTFEIITTSDLGTYRVWFKPGRVKLGVMCFDKLFDAGYVVTNCGHTDTDHYMTISKRL